MDENILVGALYRNAASGEVVRVKSLANDAVYVESTFLGVYPRSYSPKTFQKLFPERFYETLSSRRDLPIDGEWYEISIGVDGVNLHAADDAVPDADVAVSRFSEVASTEDTFMFSRPFCTVVVERRVWSLLPTARRLKGSEVLARFPPEPPTSNDEVPRLRAQLASARADVATEKAERGRLECEAAALRRENLHQAALIRDTVGAKAALREGHAVLEEVGRRLGARADENTISAADRIVRELEAALSDVAKERAERERLERQLAAIMAHFAAT